MTMAIAMSASNRPKTRERASPTALSAVATAVVRRPFAPASDASAARCASVALEPNRTA